MKKFLFALLCIVTLASCTKEEVCPVEILPQVAYHFDGNSVLFINDFDAVVYMQEGWDLIPYSGYYQLDGDMLTLQVHTDPTQVYVFQWQADCVFRTGTGITLQY
jgi:hypothetical protein